MNSPFSNISSLQKNKLIKKLETHIYKYNKNEEILPTLKNTDIICIVLEGCAKMININYLGEESLIEELFEDSVFGTSISGIDNIEIQIRAIEPTKILVIDYNKLINEKHLDYSYYNTFIFNLFKIINTKLKENNNRIKILTKKNIRDKLLAFFENEYKRSHSKNIYLPYTFKDLADYLSINRSAMFRELKNLKEEKFIKVEGKKIILQYTPNI